MQYPYKLLPHSPWYAGLNQPEQLVLGVVNIVGNVGSDHGRLEVLQRNQGYQPVRVLTIGGISTIRSIKHQRYQPPEVSTIRGIRYQPSEVSTIRGINHQRYQPSEVLTIRGINHQRYQPSGVSTIRGINRKGYQPLEVSTIRQGWALRSFPFGTIHSFPF